jgi:hypothetical protein
MIRLRCDRCEKTLEVPDDLEGKKIECPACGDVNQVPWREGPGPRAGAGAGVARAAPMRDRAAAAGYPPDSGPETRVMLVRPVVFRSRPLRSLLVLALMIAGAAGIVTVGWVRPMMMLAWASGAALGAGLVTVLAWKVATLTESLEITNKRTVERRGLLSKATTEVLHDHVRNVQITQTMWQRVWGIGRVGLSSSAQDDVEIVMNGLPSPEKIKRVIDLYRPM